MDTFIDFSQRLLPGRPIKLVVYGDGGAQSIKGVVCGSEPLKVKLREGNGGLARPGTRALLFATDKAQFVKAEAKVSKIEQDADEWVWEFAGANWQELDRRKYERHPYSTEVQMKAVQENAGVTEIIRCSGKSVDLSMGGAWVTTDRAVEVGSLVNFCITEVGELRILGIVTHVDADGKSMGLEFMDFFGSSRDLLKNLLSKQAA